MQRGGLARLARTRYEKDDAPALDEAIEHLKHAKSLLWTNLYVASRICIQLAEMGGPTGGATLPTSTLQLSNAKNCIMQHCSYIDLEQARWHPRQKLGMRLHMR